MLDFPVFVDHFSVALGDHPHSVEAAAAAGRLISGAQAFRDAGFRQHWVAAPKTTAYDLALRAVEPIRQHLGQVGAIIYSTCLTLNGNLGTQEEFDRSRDVKHLLDYPASHLQAHLDLAQATVIGLNQQACTSVIGSLRLGRALFAAEPELQEILCVSADRFPEGALYEQAYNLISDGASAFRLSRQPSGFRLLGHAAITNGALAQASDDETVGTYFNFTHQTILRAVASAGLQMRDIHWVIPQNTNQKAWQILARILGMDFSRVCCPTLGEVGHIISSDNIVNLVTLEKMGKFASGDRLLLCMAGYGLNWQAAVLEKV